MRNIEWTRDELILALDLYFSLSYGQMDGRNPDVNKLSDLLSVMNETYKFSRSPSSVSLKLANFKRMDPDFGGKGMKGGSKLELGIWDDFTSDKIRLNKVAKSIKSKVLKTAIKNRKEKFRIWLEKTGKNDGSDYNIRTIQVYTNQIEKEIVREFILNIDEPGGIYLINDIKRLRDIGLLLKEGEDTKKRRDLRSAFQSYLRYYTETFEFDDDSNPEEERESITEGGVKVFISTKIERDARLKNKAIAFHGLACRVCDFSYGEKYGKWGEGFIEVHHLIPLGGENKKKRITDPENDLVVLCANCHRMIHRKKNTVLTIQELRRKIQEANETNRLQ